MEPPNITVRDCFQIIWQCWDQLHPPVPFFVEMELVQLMVAREKSGL